jgi:predicted HTH domain antitoxin
MGTIRINFEIPKDILNSLNASADEFVAQMRLFAALHLFKTHKLTLGKAAELAGINKEHFVLELDRHEIPLIDYDANELVLELGAFSK